MSKDFKFNNDYLRNDIHNGVTPESLLGINQNNNASKGVTPESLLGVAHNYETTYSSDKTKINTNSNDLLNSGIVAGLIAGLGAKNKDKFSKYKNNNNSNNSPWMPGMKKRKKMDPFIKKMLIEFGAAVAGWAFIMIIFLYFAY